MKDLNIYDVIKAVPMDEELRNEVLSQYESYEESKKFHVTKICWEAFNAMEEALRDYYQEQIMQEVAAGTKKVENMYDAIQNAVEKDIEERIIGKKKDAENLDAIRKQLEHLMVSNTHNE